MIFFSIIIPHKNIPHLLDRCLRSIPVRDEVQTIVIDDSSDEENEKSLKNLESLYPRVEFLFAKNKKRQGAGFARNIGLEHAKGKWLIFADADDFFLPDFDKMLDKYVSSDSDMICFSNTCVDSDDISKEKEHPHFDMHSKIAEAVRDGLDIIRYNTGIVWCRFIKRDLIIKHKIRFQETFCRNDTLFAAQIGCKSNKIIIDDTDIYCYTQRKDSLLSSFETEKGQRTRYLAAKKVMQYLRKQRKGFPLFNGDLIYHYELLKEKNAALYKREFLSVLSLTTNKKDFIGKFAG
jgi:glycosyltransferase involved in cell wall biosynthesis